MRLSTMSENDAPKLQQLLKELYQKGNWELVSGEPYESDFFERTIKKPGLPPNGTIDSARRFSIRDKRSGDYIGWLGVYYGFPRKGCLWISEFFFAPTSQGHGYGQELAWDLIQKTKQRKSFDAIQLGVFLKNWPALRFWSQIGFNKMVRFGGDKEYGPDKNCTVALEFTL